MAYEKTLLLLKPGVRERKIVGKIISRFEDKSLDICACKLLSPTKAIMSVHYAEHKGKPFYKGLLQYMTSAPIFAIVVGGKNAIAICRVIVGATNPIDASPGSVRGDFALSLEDNVIHASDSSKSAAREIKIFFKPAEIM